MEYKNLSANEKLVLAAMERLKTVPDSQSFYSSFQNDYKEIGNISLKSIQEESGVKSVSATIKKLEEKEIIQVKRDQSSEYGNLKNNYSMLKELK